MQRPFPFLALLLIPSLPSVTPCWLSLLPFDSHGAAGGFQVDLFHVFPGTEAAVPQWSSGCPKYEHNNCLFPGMSTSGDTTRPAPSEMPLIWSQGSICLNGPLTEPFFITGDASPRLGFSPGRDLSSLCCHLLWVFLCVCCYSHFPRAASSPVGSFSPCLIPRHALDPDSTGFACSKELLQEGFKSRLFPADSRKKNRFSK